MAAANAVGGLGRFSTPPPVGGYIAALLISVLALSALFTVRSYTISGGCLLIRRLLWSTRLPLSGLMRAQVENLALGRCIRTCGNGGMFAFTGWYWSKPLGHFRAYATDCRRAVVLRFIHRTVVVTPERPEEFAAEITREAHRL